MQEYVYIRCSTEEQSPELQLNDIYQSFPNSNQAVALKENISAWNQNS
jgi:DNA invertase Pin-like site-specific DNA recombinase